MGGGGGGDDDAVQAGAQEAVEVGGVLGTEFEGQVVGLAFDGVVEDDPLHGGQSDQGLGVEGADPAGTDESDAHARMPPVRGGVDAVPDAYPRFVAVALTMRQAFVLTYARSELLPNGASY